MQSNPLLQAGVPIPVLPQVRVRIEGPFVPTPGSRWTVCKPAAPVVSYTPTTSAGKLVERALEQAGILPRSGMCSRHATERYALFVGDIVIGDTEIVEKVIHEFRRKGRVFTVRRLPTKPRYFDYDVALFVFKAVVQFLVSAGLARYAYTYIVQDLKPAR